MSVPGIVSCLAASIVVIAGCNLGSRGLGRASPDASALMVSDAGGRGQPDTSATIGPDAGEASAAGADTDGGNEGDVGVDGEMPRCPPPASEVCVDPAPSFANTILPILNRSCNTCHDPNVSSGPWPLTDYADVMAWSLAIADDLVACEMPPPDGGTILTESDRQLLFAWLNCGAPPDLAH